MRISIYGVGNFGFALIRHLSRNLQNKQNVSLIAYDRNKKLINNLKEKRKHLYHHKNITIKKNIVFTNDPKNIFQNANMLILAATSNAILEIINKNKKYINKHCIILNTAKALDYQSGKCFSEIITKIPGVNRNKCHFAVLSGGTIASDLFHHEPLGVDIACKSSKCKKC